MDDDTQKSAFAIILTLLVVITLACVAALLYLHLTLASPPLVIQYNNTTTVQCNCYEQPKVNCSATVVPVETYGVKEITTFIIIDDHDIYKGTPIPTAIPTQTPLATPEFPFLPIR